MNKAICSIGDAPNPGLPRAYAWRSLMLSRHARDNLDALLAMIMNALPNASTRKTKSPRRPRDLPNCGIPR
jgi:hypothetical protein